MQKFRKGEGTLLFEIGAVCVQLMAGGEGWWARVETSSPLAHAEPSLWPLLDRKEKEELQFYVGHI